MKLLLDLAQEPTTTTTTQLSPGEGEELRNIIVRESALSFNTYLEMVGIKPTNAYNYLSGRNRISILVLQKLLAGTNLKLQCSLSIQILKDDGSPADHVDSMSLEEMLCCTEPATSTEETTSIHPPFPQPTQPCSLSEKLPDRKRITPDSHSKEDLDEYFTMSFPSLYPLLTTT